MTAKQRLVIIPGDQLEERIDGYGGKDFEKRGVLARKEINTDSYFTEFGRNRVGSNEYTEWPKSENTPRFRYYKPHVAYWCQNCPISCTRF